MIFFTHFTPMERVPRMVCCDRCRTRSGKAIQNDFTLRSVCIDHSLKNELRFYCWVEVRLLCFLARCSKITFPYGCRNCPVVICFTCSNRNANKSLISSDRMGTRMRWYDLFALLGWRHTRNKSVTCFPYFSSKMALYVFNWRE